MGVASKSRSRVHRGMRSQKVIALYLADNGFPFAESTGSGRSGTDVTGVVGVDIEVKARAGFEPLAALRQLKERSKVGLLGLFIMRLNGQGEENVKDWLVGMRLEDAVNLLRGSGYGDKR